MTIKETPALASIVSRVMSLLEERGADLANFGGTTCDEITAEIASEFPMFAAAPELFGAVERARNVFVGWRVDADPDYDTRRGENADLDAAHDNLDAMQAAIEKAGGQ